MNRARVVAWGAVSILLALCGLALWRGEGDLWILALVPALLLIGCGFAPFGVMYLLQIRRDSRIRSSVCVLVGAGLALPWMLLLNQGAVLLDSPALGDLATAAWWSLMGCAGRSLACWVLRLPVTPSSGASQEA